MISVITPPFSTSASGCSKTHTALSSRVSGGAELQMGHNGHYESPSTGAWAGATQQTGRGQDGLAGYLLDSRRRRLRCRRRRRPTEPELLVELLHVGPDLWHPQSRAERRWK